MKKERFEAITDAVMAIILTLMVLEIKIPELTIGNLPRILQQLLIYAVSFVTIAIIWLNHHNIFVLAEKTDLDLVWLNFFLLFFTSLIPIATAHLSESFHHRPNHIFYGAVTGTTSAFYSLVQQRVLRQTATRQTGPKDAGGINRMNWITTALYFSSIPLSYFSVYISGCIFLGIPTMYFMVSRKSPY